MKLKYLFLLCACLICLCTSQNAQDLLIEEQIQEELKELQQQFDEMLSYDGGIEEFLNRKKNEENQTEDNKCISKHYLGCQEENREECIKKSFYQISCANLRCGFELDQERAEVYGSCIQRQCISDSEEVQKLSLQTYQCLYASKYSPENVQERQTNFEQRLQEFQQEFEDLKSQYENNFDGLKQELMKQSNEKDKECIENYLFSKQDLGQVKQGLLQVFCLSKKCEDKDGNPTAEIIGACFQNQCKSDIEQQKKLDYEFYQCLYLSKYKSQDDKYVLEKTNTTKQESHSSLMTLSLIAMSVLLF
ncbi:hypothetical protein ABPG74_003692 [Tetrahymena malaccensis]